MSALRPTLRFGLVLAGLLSLHCDPPPVEATADHRQRQNLSRIEGQVVVQGRVRGNAIVLLYDAARPPPPQGTGRPLSFTVIPQERLFGPADDTSAGPFTAPYTFSLVAPGRYLVRGFIDADTCRTLPQPCHTPDFIPWYTVTGEPNAGDMGGAAVDPVTRAPRLLELAENADGTLPALTGVNVLFGETSTVPVDRPAFWVDSPPRFERTTSIKLLELKPLQIHQGAVDQRPTGMLVRFVDDNTDGVPDDANGDSVPDLWPRVVVRKLAEGESLTDAQRLADENDLDRNGVLDAEGAEYPRMEGPGDGQPDLVVLAAGLDTTVLNSMRKPDGTWNMGLVFVDSLRVVVQARAFDARNPQQPQPLRAVPSGRYALTLIHFTGQTWRVPNELSPSVAAADGLPEVKNQSFVLEVP
ncbi:hypothetical protein [Cystobacter fuscus]|uniref:hypothetical protein n=1 Tax=Cystobacter fuscus TaxID=43 RepID=UPI002B2AED4E|nr:hypothetical protein F0U63_41615 [Cystobacter fuscus]